MTLLQQARSLKRNSQLPQTTPFQRYCYHLKSQRKPDAEIAAEANATIEEIREAYQAVELWIANNSLPIAQAKLTEQALSAAETSGRVLRDAQRARRLVSPPQPELKDAEGNVVASAVPAMFEPDHDTRLKAVDTVIEMVKAVAPTGPATQVNVGIGINNNGNGGGSGRSFESRLRAKREEMGLNAQHRLPAGDDEIIDGEMDDDDDMISDEAADEITDDELVSQDAEA